MDKSLVKRIADITPNTLKVLKGFAEESFEKNGQEVLDNTNGIAGVLIKFFAKEKIDEYFENKTKDKLKNYGSEIYLKASLIQISESLENIELE